MRRAVPGVSLGPPSRVIIACVVRTFLRRLGWRLRIGSLQRGDFTGAKQRPSENLDGMTAARDDEWSGSTSGAEAPVRYVPPVDEGRPRK